MHTTSYFLALCHITAKSSSWEDLCTSWQQFDFLTYFNFELCYRYFLCWKPMRSHHVHVLVAIEYSGFKILIPGAWHWKIKSQGFHLKFIWKIHKSCQPSCSVTWNFRSIENKIQPNIGTPVSHTGKIDKREKPVYPGLRDVLFNWCIGELSIWANFIVMKAEAHIYASANLFI